MPAMMRTDFERELEEGLNSVFGLEYDDYPDEWRAAFPVFKSKKAYEEDVLVSGFGAAPVKAEGAGVQYDTAKEGYASRYTHETIAMAFAITREARDDNLYMDLGAKFSKALARSMKQTKELKAAAIFNNGHSTYQTGDGVSLFNTAHPLQGGGTFSNRLTTAADLSESSIEDVLVAIAGFTDERGIPVMIDGFRLIIPRQEKYTAKRLMESSLRPGTADNDLNAIKEYGDLPGGFHVMRRLTDANDCFVVTDAQDGLKYFERVPIETSTDGEFDSGNFRYQCYERYVFGASDPRGAYSFGT